jgi:Zn-finger nucleic acid-binding protein
MLLKPGAEFFTCEYCSNIFFPEPNQDGVRVFGDADESCSLCSVRLSNASIVGHRIRYCSRCRGMLVGMGAFTAIVDALRSRRELSGDGAAPPDWHDLDRKLRCPQCRNVMDTHLYAGPGNVIIDSCETCVLVWLDYGELERIVRSPDPQIEELGVRSQ